MNQLLYHHDNSNIDDDDDENDIVIDSNTNIDSQQECNIIQQFQTIFGLHISKKWLRQCYNAILIQQPRSCSITRTTTTSAITDLILEQVLYHDLRDVVQRRQQQQQQNDTNDVLLNDDDEDDEDDIIVDRTTTTTTTTNVNTNNNNHTTNIQILRQAIYDSQQHQCKVVLPYNFRCCLQIEEIMDVTKSRENRLLSSNSTTTATTTTTSIGQQQQQQVSSSTTTIGSSGSSNGCYKLAMIDGHYPTQVIMGLEVSSLSMDVPIQPGTKILLFGGSNNHQNNQNSMIIIRHGIIGLHIGNCIVLGGHVNRLIQIQQLQYQQQQQLSGYTIDPTIRALLWNHQLQQHIVHDDENDENNEGEQESSDVVVPLPLPIQQQQQPLGMIPQQQQAQSRISPTFNTIAQQVLPLTNHNRIQPLASSSSSTSTTSTISNNNNNSNSNRINNSSFPTTAASRPLDPMSAPSTTLTTTTKTSGSNSSSSSSFHSSRVSSASSLSINRPSTTTTTVASAFVQQQQQSLPVNRYIKASIVSHPVQQEQYTTVTTSAATTTTSSSVIPITQNVPEQHVPIQNVDNTNTMNTTNNNDTPPRKGLIGGGWGDPPPSPCGYRYQPTMNMTTTTTTTTSSSNNDQHKCLSYTQFYALLRRLIQNVDEYRTFYNNHQNTNSSIKDIVLVGPIQQVGPKLYFNIDKVSNRNTSIQQTSNSEQRTQHEYVMHAKFGNRSEIDDLITCRISSTILEPCFSISAGELRKLSRLDKQKSGTIVRDGGKAALQKLYQFETYEVTLQQSPEEFFHSAAITKPHLDGEIPFIYLKKCID